MQQQGIEAVDRAALDLIRALDTYSEELKPYLEPHYLDTLRQAIVHLRRVLLGSQMGTLYPPEWEVPPDLLDALESSEHSPPEGAEEEDESATEMLNNCGSVE